ncbi:hypothetical protein G7Y89_g8969 [Cudoniella acicularis]|uniref:Heterokaryon incompatibility domain-containing protein n=1 Tax=Cudoniella acicularis TaxID=354080 RepID=A0A8H4RID7_9HELO|nr:hypothetical protein G7Y89_g8969 [Cudoniella acicularis]
MRSNLPLSARRYHLPPSGSRAPKKARQPRLVTSDEGRALQTFAATPSATLCAVAARPVNIADAVMDDERNGPPLGTGLRLEPLFSAGQKRSANMDSAPDPTPSLTPPPDVEPTSSDGSHQGEKQILVGVDPGDALICSAMNGDDEEIKRLLDGGANPSDASEEGMTSLHGAAQNGHETIVRLLLDRGAEASAAMKEGWTPLHAATLTPNIAIMRLLIERGADVSAATSTGVTALHVAAERNYTDVVKLLIERGTDVLARVEPGFTALHIAARMGFEEITRLLLQDSGAEVPPSTSGGKQPPHVGTASEDTTSGDTANGDAANRDDTTAKIREAILSAVLPDGRTALHMAALQGHESVVRLLLEKGAEASAKNNEGRTALHIATCQKHDSVVKVLLEKGADASAKDNDEQTALHMTTQLNYEPLVQLLLNQGAEASAKDNEGLTPLHIAARDGHIGIVKILLLSPGTDVSAGNNAGVTPLHLASFQGYEEMAKFLLSHGADASAKVGLGWNTLIIAASCGQEAIVRLLLPQPGIKISERGYLGQSALYSSAEKGHVEVVKLLLEHGADVLGKDDEEQTALHIAAQNGHAEVVKTLLDHSSDVALEKDKNGRTALHIATTKAQAEVIGVLLDHGVSTSETDPKEWTALHIAAQLGHEDIVKLLVDGGANVSAEKTSGWSVIHSAAGGGHEGVIKILLDHGAEMSATKHGGWTVLHTAAERGHEGAFKLFLDRGAALSARNNGWTPLLIAAEYGRPAMVKMLLERGVQLSEANDDGNTALHVAAEYGQDDVAKLLIDEGAKLSALNNKGWNAFRMAAVHGNESIAVLIFKQRPSLQAEKWRAETTTAEPAGKAPPEENNDDSVKEERTPLQEAAQGGNETDVSRLLDERTMALKTRTDAWTALSLATKSGHEAIVKFFADHGSELAVSSDERTAIQLAMEKGHDGIVQLLCKHLEVPTAALGHVVKFPKLSEAPGTKDIRLLYLDAEGPEGVISGKLEVASLADNPHFVGLSYAWGEPVFDHVILCDGLPLRITKGLHSALKRLRKTDEKVFWIDQICVNQRDMNDRSVHVSIMAQVYKQADAVFIWLGDHDETTKEGIEMAEYVAECSAATNAKRNKAKEKAKEKAEEEDEEDKDEDEAKGVDEEDGDSKSDRGISLFWLYMKPGLSLEETWTPWLKLWSSRWWSRQWVIQEYVCARKLQFFCGDFEISEKLLLTGLLMANTGMHPSNFFSSGLEAKRNINNFSEMFIVNRDPTIYPLTEPSAFQGFNCSDPRDKIYARMGIGPEDPGLPMADYSKKLEIIYQEFAEYFVRSERGAKMILRSGLQYTDLKLPTWCPDWNSQKRAKRGRDRRCTGASALPAQVWMDPRNSEQVGVDGSIVDIVAETGPTFQDDAPIIKFLDLYAAWFKESLYLINSALDKKYTEDSTALRLWCRLLVGAHTPNDRQVEFLTDYHNEIYERAEKMAAKSSSPPLDTDKTESNPSKTETDPDQVESPPRQPTHSNEASPDPNDEENPPVFNATSMPEIIECSACKICITSKGYLGIVGQATQRGDKIAVLFGVSYLKILRGTENPYQNVENAFLLPPLGEDFLKANNVGEGTKEEILLC